MIPIPMIFCCQIMLSVMCSQRHHMMVPGWKEKMCTCVQCVHWSGAGASGHELSVSSYWWEGTGTSTTWPDITVTRERAAESHVWWGATQPRWGEAKRFRNSRLKYFAVSQLALVCRLMCDLVHCTGIVVEMLIHQLFILLGHLIEYYGWVWSAHDSNWRGWFISQINFL